MIPESLDNIDEYFFIGIAGAGMSAIAQYLAGNAKSVSGSDRFFIDSIFNETREQLERSGIKCYPQNGTGLTAKTQLVIVSTAVEDTVPEVAKAKELGIPIIKRSDLLAMITLSKRTIAVGGTSGKSSTGGMIFRILTKAGLDPSIISGAGLVSIIKTGKIGNAHVGAGEWLIIEADESDGSIVKYKPEIGLLLNIDKDHQETDELLEIFSQFKNNSSSHFIVNRGNALSAGLSKGSEFDFSAKDGNAPLQGTEFKQEGMHIYFSINGIPFQMNAVGRHSMENALAAVAVANAIDIPTEVCASALANYEGIYRRHQLLGTKNGVIVIDDYAHNPAKCAASIAACQPLAPKVIAWFQPHGYGPTKFLKNEFVEGIAAVLRPRDEIWMSEIFYAGGTAEKTISANDLILEISAEGKIAFFTPDRNDLLAKVRSHFEEETVLLLMGARDPGLEAFSKNLFEQL